MKPRTSVYHILARCKAAKHGKSFKAKRTQENAKFNKEIAGKHHELTRQINESWSKFQADY